MQQRLKVVLAFMLLLGKAELAWAESAADQNGQTPANTEAKKEVSLIVESITAQEDYITVALRWENPTTHDLVFIASSAHHPRYKMQRWMGDQWVDHDAVYFCDLGLQRCSIPSGQSSDFQVRVKRSLFPIRVGVSYYLDRQRGNGRMVWSDKIEAVSSAPAHE